MIRQRVIVLYGPPTAGKDTVTGLLEGRNQEYVHFKKAKYGTGRTVGYRMVNSPPSRDRIVSSVNRYTSSYYVLKQDLDTLILSGRTPIIHTSSIQELLDIRNYTVQNFGFRPTDVLLYVSFATFVSRSLKRGDSDHESRIATWLNTYNELSGNVEQFDIILDTDFLQAEDAATIIEKNNARTGGDKASALGCRIRSPFLIPVPSYVRSQQTVIAFSEGNGWYPELLSKLIGNGFDILVAGPTGRGDRLSSAGYKKQVETAIECVDRDRLVIAASNRRQFEIANHLLQGESKNIMLSGTFATQLAATKGGWSPDNFLLYPRKIWGSAPSEPLKTVLNQQFGVSGVKVHDTDGFDLEALRQDLGDHASIISSSGRRFMERFIQGYDQCTAVNLLYVDAARPSRLDHLKAVEAEGRKRRLGKTSEERLMQLEEDLGDRYVS